MKLGAGGDRGVQQFAQQLGGALQGQVLAIHEIDGECSHLGPPSTPALGLLGGTARWSLPTSAAAVLDDVVSDLHPDLGDLQHLAPGRAHHGRTGQIGPTAPTAHRDVGERLVRDAPCQVRTRRTRLLAWRRPASRAAALRSARVWRGLTGSAEGGLDELSELRLSSLRDERCGPVAPGSPPSNPTASSPARRSGRPCPRHRSTTWNRGSSGLSRLCAPQTT
jgi:hypothetical protein